jgi:uncharacterized protein (TIGR03435 family)
MLAEILLLPLCLLAPQQTAKFEVASVKRHAPGVRLNGFRVSPGGEWIAPGWALKDLVAEVYLMDDFRIVNAPGWMNTELYDFDAKPESTGQKVDRELVRFMIQNLIVDRFQLKFHWESREWTQYDLVVAKGGSKLPASTSEESLHEGRGYANAKGVKVEWLAAVLTSVLRRPVNDRTGITGMYDISLKYTPDDSFDPESPPVDAAGPSLFAALQEQLGLKLVSKKMPTQFMVIDSVERAQEN